MEEKNIERSESEVSGTEKPLVIITPAVADLGTHLQTDKSDFRIVGMEGNSYPPKEIEFVYSDTTKVDSKRGGDSSQKQRELLHLL